MTSKTQEELDRAHAYRLHPKGHANAAPWWEESPDTPSEEEWEKLPKICSRRRFWLILIFPEQKADLKSHCLHGTDQWHDGVETRQCCRCWCLR